MNNSKLVFTFYIILFLLYLGQIKAAHAGDDLWQEITAKARSTPSSMPFRNSRSFFLNEEKMQHLLKPSRYARKGVQANRISLPLPNGKTVVVTPIASHVLPPALAKKYPQIRTYKVLNQQGNLINGKLDFTTQGFHAMLQMNNGEIVYINPIANDANQPKSKRRYSSYRQKDQHPNAPHHCSLKDSAQRAMASSVSLRPSRYKKKSSRSTDLHYYRIAIATTGEYTQQQGGTVTSALSAIVTTINRVNQIYERDLGIHLNLVDHNDEIIYSDPNSDPYSNGDSDALLDENQQNLDQVIGQSNYDLGHVFGTAGGGLAILNVLCSKRSKAKGTSGISDLNSENFYIDFVAHEIGHQLGATHTFNSTKGVCSGDTRTSRTAFEPGSGSTIMAYTGICGSDNLQPQADAMFHIGSIEQIKTNLATDCGTHKPNPNQAPSVNAGNDYTIPANTPFLLQGTAIDPENDPLSYAWQQIDTGSRSSVNYDQGNNPLFRSRLATKSPARSFPILSDILTHQHTKGETLPNTQRTLHFKFSAQDGNDNTSSDQITLQVEHTGSRFALDLPYSQYTIAEPTDIIWNVAKTDQPPINCDSIDIYLSTDSGKTFNTLLASDVINNGKATIYIPNNITPTDNARFKISCSNNIFFAISYNDFTLSYSPSNHQAPSSPEPNIVLIANQQITEPTRFNSRMKAGTVNPFIFLLILLLAIRNTSLLRND